MTKVGLDPTKRKIVIAKSTQHFHAGFAPIAKEVLYARRPARWRRIRDVPYTKLTRPYWPRVPIRGRANAAPAPSAGAARCARAVAKSASAVPGRWHFGMGSGAATNAPACMPGAAEGGFRVMDARMRPCCPRSPSCGDSRPGRLFVPRRPVGRSSRNAVEIWSEAPAPARAPARGCPPSGRRRELAALRAVRQAKIAFPVMISRTRELSDRSSCATARIRIWAGTSRDGRGLQFSRRVTGQVNRQRARSAQDIEDARG